MTIEQLQRLHRARPFQPFRIHLADGRHLDVYHPELLAHSATGRTASVATPDDAFEIVDLLLITSLQTLNGSQVQAQRGS